MDIVFLGMAHGYVDDLFSQSNLIWVMNDWYQFYPQLRNPNKIYNIHEEFSNSNYEDIVKKTGRYRGDWRQKYNESCATIVVLSDLNVKNQYVFKNILNYEGEFFGSTFGYMAHDAILLAKSGEDVSVKIQGATFSKKEDYEHQIYSVIYNINEMRKFGIDVSCEMRGVDRESIWRKRLNVDWTNIKSFLFYGQKEGLQKVIDKKIEMII